MLFVGTPALLIPLFSAAQVRWDAQDIYLFVGAFGAMGHHLPGMIRAYGDKALFQRFRIRFLIAPFVIAAVCVWSAIYNIQAIQLLALGWGIWHGMMQTYGFCRIYDAKAMAKAVPRARADFALCFAWFIGAVVLSRLRFRSCLELYYSSGGPAVPAWGVIAFRTLVMVALAWVTLVFVWRHWKDARAGMGLSPVKVALLVSSISFWWYCNNGVQNILVGVALFEVFHDVQYLSIVWIYNRSRVERDESIKGFMRFVFRQSGSLIGVYVGLVLAYGSISFLSVGTSIEWVRQGLVGIVTASALLHFYYDGFIWKIREKENRSVLGVAGAGVIAKEKARPLPRWLAHSVRWAALAIPFGALCASQLLGRVVPPLERNAKVVEVLPRDAKAHLNYGKALHDAGRVADAQAEYRAAVTLNPKLEEAQMLLALAFSDLKQYDQAVVEYEKALVLNPKDVKAECNLGSLLRYLGRRDEARVRLEHSLSVDPKLFLAHKELGDLLCSTRELPAAISHYEEAIRLRPDFAEAKAQLQYARTVTGR